MRPEDTFRMYYEDRRLTGEELSRIKLVPAAPRRRQTLMWIAAAVAIAGLAGTVWLRFGEHPPGGTPDDKTARMVLPQEEDAAERVVLPREHLALEGIHVAAPQKAIEPETFEPETFEEVPAEAPQSPTTKPRKDLEYRGVPEKLACGTGRSKLSVMAIGAHNCTVYVDNESFGIAPFFKKVVPAGVCQVTVECEDGELFGRRMYLPSDGAEKVIIKDGMWKSESWQASKERQERRAAKAAGKAAAKAKREWDEAAELCNQDPAKEPPSAIIRRGVAFNKSGWACLKVGKPQTALRRFERCFVVDAKFEECHSGLLETEGEIAQAAAERIRIEAGLPVENLQSAKDLYKQGIGFLRNGDNQSAEARFLQCLETDPNYCLCYRALGITYAKRGDGERAAAAYRRYLKTCPHATDADQVRELLGDDPPLAPMTIRISPVTADGKLYLDGRQFEFGENVLIDELEVGTHVIRVEAAGYRAKEYRVSYEGTPLNLEVHLAPADKEAAPEAAEIPNARNVSVGAPMLNIKRRDVSDGWHQVTLSGPDTLITLDLKFAPNGELLYRLRTEPWFIVRSNGAGAGKTPLLDHRMTTHRTRFELLNPKEGQRHKITVAFPSGLEPQ